MTGLRIFQALSSQLIASINAYLNHGGNLGEYDMTCVICIIARLHEHPAHPILADENPIFDALENWLTQESERDSCVSRLEACIYGTTDLLISDQATIRPLRTSSCFSQFLHVLDDMVMKMLPPCSPEWQVWQKIKKSLGKWMDLPSDFFAPTVPPASPNPYTEAEDDMKDSAIPLSVSVLAVRRNFAELETRVHCFDILSSRSYFFLSFQRHRGRAIFRCLSISRICGSLAVNFKYCCPSWCQKGTPRSPRSAAITVMPVSILLDVYCPHSFLKISLAAALLLVLRRQDPGPRGPCQCSAYRADRSLGTEIQSSAIH